MLAMEGVRKPTSSSSKRRGGSRVIHTCETCGKTFGKKSNMIAHTRVHSGETPYKCRRCDKSFKWLSSLTTHVAGCQGDPNATVGDDLSRKELVASDENLPGHAVFASPPELVQVPTPKLDPHSAANPPSAIDLSGIDSTAVDALVVGSATGSALPLGNVAHSLPSKSSGPLLRGHVETPEAVSSARMLRSLPSTGSSAAPSVFTPVDMSPFPGWTPNPPHYATSSAGLAQGSGAAAWSEEKEPPNRFVTRSRERK
mmetsp:Transcript_41924/g.103186  ORF Transcript_41924/g.103186 Transcript_41924/m.103186 type:complete len:256 (-) Transcript_41924:1784-2551(-)